MNQESEIPYFQLNQHHFQHLLPLMPKNYQLVPYRPYQKKALPSSPIPTLRTTRQKKSSFSRFFLDNSGVPRNLSDQMRKCYVFLQNLMQHQQVTPFLQSVDWQTLGLWDYPKIIKEPMDLSEVERKLVENRYQNRLDFAKDIKLIWKNAMTYNKPNQPVYNMALEMSLYFEQKFKEKILSDKQMLDLKENEFNNKLVNMQQQIKSLYQKKIKSVSSQSENQYENIPIIVDQLKEIFQINPLYQIELYQILNQKLVESEIEEQVNLYSLSNGQLYVLILIKFIKKFIEKKLQIKEKNIQNKKQKKSERINKLKEKIRISEASLQQVQEIDKINQLNSEIENLKNKLQSDFSDHSIISENSSDYFETVKS